MAWDHKRRGLGEVGRWAFLTHNLSFALLALLALVMLLAGRAQGSWVDTVRSFAQDIVSPVFGWVAGPSSSISRWTEGLGAAVEVYAENQRLRDENAKLLAFQNEAIELRQRVTRYEALLNTGPQPGAAFVTGRVIADASGAYSHTLILGAGRDVGVAKGQAVTNEQGLVGHIVNAGHKSARVLLLRDISSRIPVRLERANVKAILAGDNSANPYLDFLPRNSVLVIGDRVVTASDGGVFPPGIPVGVVNAVNGQPRVDVFADERRADFVRILKYEVPIDVDDAGPEPLPGSGPGSRPRPPAPAQPQVVPPMIAEPRGVERPQRASDPVPMLDTPVTSGQDAAPPVDVNRR